MIPNLAFENKKIFFTSDIHFGHYNIIKYCNRPFNYLAEMNYTLKEIWNNTISKDDVIVNLGDTFFKSFNIVKELNGYHILIKGNHDKEKFNNLYKEAYQYASIRVGKWNVLLSHRPFLLSDPYFKNSFSKEQKKLINSYDFIICGHVHNSWINKGKHLNVGIDIWERPISIDFVEYILNKISNGEEINGKKI